MRKITAPSCQEAAPSHRQAARAAQRKRERLEDWPELDGDGRAPEGLQRADEGRAAGHPRASLTESRSD
jgi:hypothetical protein